MFLEVKKPQQHCFPKGVSFFSVLCHLTIRMGKFGSNKNFLFLWQMLMFWKSSKGKGSPGGFLFFVGYLEPPSLPLCAPFHHCFMILWTGSISNWEWCLKMDQNQIVCGWTTNNCSGAWGTSQVAGRPEETLTPSLHRWNFVFSNQLHITVNICKALDFICLLVCFVIIYGI